MEKKKKHVSLFNLKILEINYYHISLKLPKLALRKSLLHNIKMNFGSLKQKNKQNYYTF